MNDPRNGMSSRPEGNVPSPIFATLGVNHKTAPIEIREVLSFTPSEASQFLTAARREKIIESGVLLSTCNRTQIFVESKLEPTDLERHLGRFTLETKKSPATYKRYLHFVTEETVMRELFLLASGYQSMVRGETQILGQIKEALQVARSSGNCSRVLLRLFEKALEVSKKVRSTQEVWAVPRSAGAAAVELLQKTKGNESLQRGKHLVLGAGQMAATLLQGLHAAGVSEIALYNRTRERADKFAESHGIQEVYSGEELATSLRGAQWLWVATSASTPIITDEMVLGAGSDGMTIFDLGLPRNVATSVGKLPSVELFCIDHLGDEGSMEMCIPKVVEKIVRSGVEEFLLWREGLKMRDVFSLIRTEAEELALQELEKLGTEKGSETHSLLQKYSTRMTDAYASTLIARLRRLTDETRDPIYAEVMRQIFTQ